MCVFSANTHTRNVHGPTISRSQKKAFFYCSHSHSVKHGWKPGKVKGFHYCLRLLRGSMVSFLKMAVHFYFDWLTLHLKRRALFKFGFPMCLEWAPCTCRQRKHVQKHTWIPFHEFPDPGSGITSRVLCLSFSTHTRKTINKMQNGVFWPDLTTRRGNNK